MTESEQDLKQIWDLHQAAQAAEAAALHFRLAADLVRSGDTHKAFAESKTAHELLRPLLPVPAVSHATAPPSLKARAVQARKTLADYLKILLPAALILGLLGYAVLSGWSGDMSKGYSGMSREEAVRSTSYPKR